MGLADGQLLSEPGNEVNTPPSGLIDFGRIARLCYTELGVGLGGYRLSDIAIRFDGLLLIASLAIAALLYFLVALGAAALRLTSKNEAQRLQHIIRAASFLGLLNLMALGIAAAYVSYWGSPASGRDWLDWLAIPILALFVFGCSAVVRSRPSPPSQSNEAGSAVQPRSPSVSRCGSAGRLLALWRW